MDSRLVFGSDLFIDSNLFRVYKTGTLLDEILSIDEKGLHKGANIVLPGDPGAGKTTISLDIVSNIQHKYSNIKVLYINSELSRIDMAYFHKRFPRFNLIPTYYVLEHYRKKNIITEIENILAEGWDIVIIDSLEEFISACRLSSKLSRGETEQWFFPFLNHHNEANNKRKVNSTFLLVQQVTKGGVFKGSQRLNHLTTGMLYIRKDDTFNLNRRYVEFTKHRRGGYVNKKLYFVLHRSDIIYDEEQFKADEKTKEAINSFYTNRQKVITEMDKQFVIKKIKNTVSIDESKKVESTVPKDLKHE